jgi:hypothetical protein
MNQATKPKCPRAEARHENALPTGLHQGGLLVDNIIDARLSSAIYYLTATIIGLIYVLILFPWDFISGQSGFWFDVRTDPTQHITGWWAFMADNWHLPLLETKVLNYPEGVSVAFTDSIPIAAIILKLFSNWLPRPPWHFFGYWVLISYVFQGLAGAYFTAALGGRKMAHAIAGTLLPMMMPSLMIRIPHAALLMQGFLILVLAWYWQSSKGILPAKTALLYQAGLTSFVALVHPYWLAMLFPIHTVTHVQAIVERQIQPKESGILFAAVIAVVAVLLLGVGYISLANGLPPKDFGFAHGSMNLLSPIFGSPLARSVFFPSGDIRLDATGLQIDGHNYLGIATISMLGIWLVASPATFLQSLRRHFLLIIVLAFFCLYAISNRVYFGPYLLVSYELPRPIVAITEIFRSSGRFFWPVGYALLFAGISFIARLRAHALSFGLLLLFVLLQYIDTAPHRAYLTEAAYRQPYYKVNHAEWSKLTAKANAIYVFPTYGCGGNFDDVLMLQYFASMRGIPFNSGFISRVRTQCEQKQARLHQEFPTGTLVVFLLKDHFPLTVVRDAIGPQTADWCRSGPVGIVCLIGSDAEDWNEVNMGGFHLLM